MRPNNSFKPTLLRGRPGVVRSRYHAAAPTAQRGLTQALDRCRTNFVVEARSAAKPHSAEARLLRTR